MATSVKNLSVYNKTDLPDISKQRFGLVVSEWNQNITGNLYQGALDALLDCGAQKENIISLDVPGSFELTAGCRHLLSTTKVDAVVAIGSVIRGETAHFDYVCSATAHGIMQLNATQDVPVIFCVLTDDTMQQAIDRSGGQHGNKGVEAAIAAIKMANL